jgi:hypothetical protein
MTDIRTERLGASQWDYSLGGTMSQSGFANLGLGIPALTSFSRISRSDKRNRNWLGTRNAEFPKTNHEILILSNEHLPPIRIAI